MQTSTTELLIGLPLPVVRLNIYTNVALTSKLEELFSYVDIISLGRCCLVCKQLRKVVESDNVWRHHVVLLLGNHFENPTRKMFKTLCQENVPVTKMLKEPVGWTWSDSSSDENVYQICGDILWVYYAYNQVIGGEQVGKTTLIRAAKHKYFSLCNMFRLLFTRPEKTTVGVDFVILYAAHNQKNCYTLYLFDVSGKKDSTELIPPILRFLRFSDCMACLVCYSIDSQTSVQECVHLIEILKKYSALDAIQIVKRHAPNVLPIFVVGLKAEVYERQVSISQARYNRITEARLYHQERIWLDVGWRS